MSQRHGRWWAVSLGMSAVALGAGALGTGGGAVLPALAQSMVPFAQQAPDVPGSAADGTTPACTTPAPVHTYAWYHCYTPDEIAAHYGVDTVHAAGDLGQDQTIVLVDSYGSPTAANDLDAFYTAFYKDKGYPAPNFDEVYPQGKPDYSNANPNGGGLSGPSGAAGWSGEATLDIEWAYAMAPAAHIVLLAVPPAETEGVQGFPNLFKAIRWAVDTYPPGTVFSQSFGVTEQTFGGAAAQQTASYDAVYKYAAEHGDTVLASSGDNGTTGADKQAKDTRTYSYPTVGWPASSPYVTSVGGTQLQDGWTWNPTSDQPFNSDGSLNPAYFAYQNGGSSEAVWNESWLPAASGGGPSAIYPRPSWQSGVDTSAGNHRLVPDVAWNAAVNGGVLVYITAFPTYQRAGWHVYGGTSAGSPQMAGVMALVNAARAADNKAPIGFLNDKLYSLSSSDFSDIQPWTSPNGYFTLTNNTLMANRDGTTPSGGVPGWSTTTGYDMTTGLGTPNVANLVAALAAM